MAFAGFRRLVAAACVVLAVTPSPPAGAQTVEVDAEIVLAVDVSHSVDASELTVQRTGYVLALTHPVVVGAIAAGSHGRIGLTYFEYARRPSRFARVPWRVVATPANAAEFAAAIAALPNRQDYGTSISRAIAEGVALIADDSVAGARRIIDVSGDGPNNAGPPVTSARDRAVAAGVTVNGLPILIRPSRTYAAIDRYYEACVIGGAGAFLLTARTPEELSVAIRRKLVLEISGTAPPARVWRAAEPASVDCMIGERRRQRLVYPDLYE